MQRPPTAVLVRLPFPVLTAPLDGDLATAWCTGWCTGWRGEGAPRTA